MNKIKSTIIILLLSIVGTFLLSVDYSQSKEIKTWRLASRSPASHPGAKAVEKFCKLVEERTNGELKINFYPSEMLMPSQDQAAAVMRGTLEIGHGSQGYDGLAVPLINAYAQPFMGLVYEDWKSIAERGTELRTIVEQAYERAGLRLIYLYPFGEEIIASIKRRPIVRIEDFKGLKLRTVGAVLSQAFRLLGAEPASMSGGEAAEALRKGILHACETDVPSALSRRYYEFAEYVNRWEFSTVFETLYVNKTAFEGLPKETQNVFSSTASEIEANMWRQVPQIREDGINELKVKGMTINSIPKKELVRAADLTQQVRNKWFEQMGATGQKIRAILEKARGN